MKIDKKIAVPLEKMDWDGLLKKMKFGNSVILTLRESNNFRSTVNRRRYLNCKIVTRLDNNGMIRAWKTKLPGA